MPTAAAALVGVPAAVSTPSAQGRLTYLAVDKTLWVAQADGTGARRLTSMPAGRPRWSPNGRTIAYTSPNGDVLTVDAANGTSTKVFTHTTHLHAWGGPVWAPDGKHLYVDLESDVPLAPGPDGLPYWGELVRLTAKKSSPVTRIVYTSVWWSAGDQRVTGNLEISRDGAVLYVGFEWSDDDSDAGAGVSTYDLTTATWNWGWATSVGPPFGSLKAWRKNASVSPDGTSVLLAAGFSTDYAHLDQPYSIYRVDADGTDAVRVLGGDGRSYTMAVWSPDGRQIAVDAPDGVVIANADGTTANLVISRGHKPDWAPQPNR